MTNTDKQKNKQNNSVKIYAQYVVYNNDGDIENALKELDKLDRFYPRDQYLGSLKIDLYSRLGRDADALELANKLSINAKNEYSKMHMQRAQLMYAYWQDGDDLQKALGAVERALTLYDSESNNEEEIPLTDNDSFKYWINEKNKSLTDMATLRVDIKGTINTNIVFQEVQRIQNNISQEKVKTIELMAVFTAILALIFANVQFSKNIEIQNILIGNIALVLCLTWLLYIVKRIQDNRPFLPFPSAYAVGRFFGFILLIFICILLFLGIIYLSVSMFHWLFK